MWLGVAQTMEAPPLSRPAKKIDSKNKTKKSTNTEKNDLVV